MLGIVFRTIRRNTVAMYSFPVLTLAVVSRKGGGELDRGHHGRVGGQKEVAIYGWEHCYQKRSRYAQLEAHTH